MGEGSPRAVSLSVCVSWMGISCLTAQGLSSTGCLLHCGPKSGTHENLSALNSLMAAGRQETGCVLPVKSLGFVCSLSQARQTSTLHQELWVSRGGGPW